MRGSVTRVSRKEGSGCILAEDGKEVHGGDLLHCVHIDGEDDAWFGDKDLERTWLQFYLD